MTTSPRSRLHTTVAALRAALAKSPDLYGRLLGGTLDEKTAGVAEADGVPGEFLAFCRVLNGADCAPSVRLFGLEEAREHQYYCRPIDGSPLPLSPDTLFCIGLLDDTPLYLDRATGAVLGIPDQHREWFDADHFHQRAPGTTEFFLDHLASPSYRPLALPGDDWLELLCRAGVVEVS
ncbi:hypothetical protein ABZX85_17785 [Streptomyces sp. NPDC004539]|uniref:hypothetical protein n=1 Tax=Streptomyces sp. NPDC004539 TaxID=3154280 RepID=UPI0033BB338F